MTEVSTRSPALRATGLALLVVLFGTALSACQGQEQKGPLERSGEKIDEKVNDAKRAVQDAAD